MLLSRSVGGSVGSGMAAFGMRGVVWAGIVWALASALTLALLVGGHRAGAQVWAGTTALYSWRGVCSATSGAEMAELLGHDWWVATSR